MSQVLRCGAVAALSIAATLLAGCSIQQAPLQPRIDSDPTSEAAALGLDDEPTVLRPGVTRAFFPLEVGNRWSYRGHVVVRNIPFQGDPSRSVLDYRARATLDCREARGDQEYVVQREEVVEGDKSTVTWIRFRQDREGLYEADGLFGPCDRAESVVEPEKQSAPQAEALSLIEPRLRASYVASYERLMARVELARRLASGVSLGTNAPEAVGPGEITRLAYPMQVGQRWVIRADPLFTAQVLALEILPLPAGRLSGFKYRIDSELFGPRDEVFFWVSRLGFLAHDFHVVGEWTDDAGLLVGQIVFDERRELVDSRIQRPGGRRQIADLERVVVTAK